MELIENLGDPHLQPGFFPTLPLCQGEWCQDFGKQQNGALKSHLLCSGTCCAEFQAVQ